MNFWFQVVKGADTPLGINPGILGLVAKLIVFVPLNLGLGGTRSPERAPGQGDGVLRQPAELLRHAVPELSTGSWEKTDRDLKCPFRIAFCRTRRGWTGLR